MLRRPEPRRGVYELPFWQHVDRQELRLQRCLACAGLRYPPAPVCPDCLSAECEWAPISGVGTVLGWTTFHRQYFPEVPVPHTVVAVETDDGPILVADYVTAHGRRAAIGERVRIVYADVAGEHGEWRIYRWQPCEESDDQ